jgi:UDP-2,3-diacylglucosamine pyrophosphatase LpxH
MSKKEKTKVDTLIISDIHLGSDVCRSEKLVEVLESYKFRKLIINGDIFESLNLKRLNTAHWNVLSRLRGYSKKAEVVWIIGNHDGAITAFSNLIGAQVYSKYVWKINGEKAIAIHGNQFDRMLTKNAILSNIAGFLYYFVKKFDTRDQIITRLIKVKSKVWLRLSEQVAKGAFRYARLLGAKYIFCGHTHYPTSEEKWGIKYYNSGSWVEIPASYITIAGNDIELIQVD